MATSPLVFDSLDWVAKCHGKMQLNFLMLILISTLRTRLVVFNGNGNVMNASVDVELENEMPSVEARNAEIDRRERKTKA